MQKVSLLIKTSVTNNVLSMVDGQIVYLEFVSNQIKWPPVLRVWRILDLVACKTHTKESQPTNRPDTSTTKRLCSRSSCSCCRSSSNLHLSITQEQVSIQWCRALCSPCLRGSKLWWMGVWLGMSPLPSIQMSVCSSPVHQGPQHVVIYSALSMVSMSVADRQEDSLNMQRV